MNRVADPRWEQLRAIEADLLSPPPPDPFTSFAAGWCRAADLTEADWIMRSFTPPPVDPVAIDRPSSRQRAVHRVPRVQRAHGAPRRAPGHQRQQPAPYQRQAAPAPQAGPPPPPVPENPAPGRRALSPSQLPGVRAIPKDYNHYFRGLLTPGEFFAKSQTQYLGPFDEMPTEASLPRGDEYIILQRMGRLPESGKSIFRQVGSITN